MKKSVAVILGVLFLMSFSPFQDNRGAKADHAVTDSLKIAFLHPPEAFRPGVYWYFMDGHLSKEGIRKDLLSMKEAGIGRVIFLEVNVGIPRGMVDFLSDQWFMLFRYAVQEAQRLGIVITLGVGPGWAGSGGPWIAPAQSMQQLVSSATQVTGPQQLTIHLPLPSPKKPYFGEGIFTPELKKQWEDYYKDVAVLAYPTPAIKDSIGNIDEKALYTRAPFSSVAHVKPFLPSRTDYPSLPAGALIAKNQIIDLTGRLQPDGTLQWTVPPGKWTIMRFVSRNNGALTRPAPIQGLGFECDKFDTVAVNAQLNDYVGKILSRTGMPDAAAPGGLKMLHLDSWEMGAQNWTPAFRKEFMRRRGYDPLPFYPVYAGDIVGSLEISERFLWDLRQTCNELVLDNYVGQLKRYVHRHGMGLSNEPYDMNPSADLELGAVADVPMGEFWSEHFGFNTSFSCIEAASIAHTEGVPVVQGEAFTADGNEDWKQYPGSMKNQGDWAFAAGINRFYYHTFAHKPFADSLRPGMTMGPYGVHWDRKQTWWPMVADYHRYISRCQLMLQQGRTVADILYLTPEGAPQVFQPPPSAMTGDTILPDRRGYNFDGCSPKQLYRATVRNHEIVFPGGATYRMLVLPALRTMTPGLLEKIRSLVKAGAEVVGTPPLHSPGLSGYPACDEQVRETARKLWESLDMPDKLTVRTYGKGKVIWGGAIGIRKGNVLYPDYDITAGVLKEEAVPADFESSGPIRYTHRTEEGRDIYFVSNRTEHPVKADCLFRTAKGAPELWDPLTGHTRSLPEFSLRQGRTFIPLQFEAYQSFFIVFTKGNGKQTVQGKNFPALISIDTLNGSWKISFDPKWGGPAQIIFDHLEDWTNRPEDGIRYYSGIAVYRKHFDLSLQEAEGRNKHFYLDLGTVKNLARVKLNGHDLGVMWTAPWQVDITGIVKARDNQLEISVANLWPNRLIGDARLPDDGIKNGKFPGWLLKGEHRPGKRYTFTTYNPYTRNSPLLSSGLIGPVTVRLEEF